MALELVAGALIGTALNELLGAIKDSRRKISSFEPSLKRLESTLVAITPKLHEIALLSKKLHHHHSKHHHHQSGIADLIILARDGKELVRKCSKLSSLNYVKKVTYSKMLHDLDCSLLRYFDTVLQLDQLKDTKEILLVLNELHCKLFPLANDNDAKSRLIHDEIRSLSLRKEEDRVRKEDRPEYTRPAKPLQLSVSENDGLDGFTMKKNNLRKEDRAEYSSSSLERKRNSQVDDRAEGSTSFERDYQGKNQAAATIHMEVLDNIIARLLEFRKVSPAAPVKLSESEIRQLCIAARDIFLQQPNLLELEAPMKICGDIHGQYVQLLRFFKYGGFPPRSQYLFLGGYVDGGDQSLETISLLLCFKIKYPQKIFLLRGSQECAHINRTNGFYDECKLRFSVRLWELFNECFNCLPVAALINDRILCVHGGISPDLKDLDQIRNIPRPSDVPETGLLRDLLFSDPCRDIQGWGMNDRGYSYTFGPDKVSEFLQKHDMDLICRAHQVVKDGYEFFADRQLITIFSAPNYCGEYDNAGAMMSVDESLMCSFLILGPARS